jgi:cytoskeletal protein RodZ
MMFSVGQRLRAARLDQGLDLEAVAARTKISEKFLKAIEADDRKSFPSGFFYKSFVDQYARALSVDAREIDEHINELLRAEAPLPLPGQDGLPIRRPSPLVVRSRGSRNRMYVSLAMLVLVLVGCSGFYAWWHKQGVKLEPAAAPKTDPGEKNSVPRETSQQSREKAPEPAAVPVSLSSNEPKAGPREIDASEPDAQPASRLLVELIARQETYLSISSDGLMVFKGTLGANESKTVEGKEFAKLRVNNAAAIDVKLNGRAIGPLGAPGQFRIVVFTRDKFHVLDSSKESD